MFPIVYFKKKNYWFFLQALTASIVYNKPDDPLQSMMKEIEVMKKQTSWPRVVCHDVQLLKRLIQL